MRGLHVGHPAGRLPKRRTLYRAPRVGQRRDRHAHRCVRIGQDAPRLSHDWASSWSSSDLSSTGSDDEFAVITGPAGDESQFSTHRDTKPKLLRRLLRRGKRGPVRKMRLNVHRSVQPSGRKRHAASGQALFLVGPSDSSSSLSERGDGRRRSHRAVRGLRRGQHALRGKVVFRYGRKGKLEGHFVSDSCSDVSSTSSASSGAVMFGQADMDMELRHRKGTVLKHADSSGVDIAEHRMKRNVGMPARRGFAKLHGNQRGREGKPYVDAATATVVTGHPYATAAGHAHNHWTERAPRSRGSIQYGTAEPVAGRAVFHVRQPHQRERAGYPSGEDYWSSASSGHHVGTDGVAMFQLAARQDWAESHTKRPERLLRAKHQHHVHGMAHVHAHDHAVSERRRHIHAHHPDQQQ